MRKQRRRKEPQSPGKQLETVQDAARTTRYRRPPPRSADPQQFGGGKGECRSVRWHT